MKIILDFDRVLFNHDAFGRAMADQDLEHLYAVPELWDELSPRDFLYPDVYDFLERYEKSNLVILSAYTARIGEHAEAYQTRKLAESGLTDIVGEVVIMDGSKAPFVSDRKTAETIFVDDKKLHVEEVFEANPDVVCVQLLRPGAERSKHDVGSKSVQHPILTASSLSEVSAIIES